MSLQIFHGKQKHFSMKILRRPLPCTP